MAPRFVAAIDHGTSSTRCILFDARGVPVAKAQREQTMHYPQPGWVELDMDEVWQRTQECIHEALTSTGASPADVAGIGITNERETVVLWDRRTGRTVAPAITWQDMRTAAAADALAADGGIDRFQQRTGLPISTYSSALKLSWLLDQEATRRDAARRGDLLFGTPDTWLLWNLTGGPNGGVHATEPTNAGRTLLMNLHTLEWDDELLESMEIPRALLPEIRSSSEVYGTAAGELSGVPVAGVLGDQQASLFGHTCFDHGDMKNTYGTGAFLLFTLGEAPVMSEHGLITTVAWKLGDAKPVYALEGSVAVAGALIQWLRDNLGIIVDAGEVEALARSVEGSQGVVFVPAFSGLFAPYWRDDARGVIVGLTRFANKGHIARAALEATAYQTYDLVEAMLADTGVARLGELRVDGGMTQNDLLMQFQADLLGSPVAVPAVTEITATGAAYAAGLATGFWSGLEELRANYTITRRWQPQMGEDERARGVAAWRKGVDRTLDLAKREPDDAGAPAPETFTFASRVDQAPIFVRKWLPPEGIAPRATVQITHGIAEHSGRYDRFARFLTAQGHVVYGIDLRGHGQTAGPENLGQAGLTAWEDMTSDIGQLSEIARADHPTAPLVAFGHSMGSALMQSHIQNHGDLLDGAILCGTLGALWFDDARYESLIRDLHALGTGPDARAPNQFLGESLAGFNAPFIENVPNPTGSEWQTSDPEEIRLFEADPLCGKPFSNAMSYSVFKGFHDLWLPENESRIPIDLPILIIAGTDDPVGGMTSTIQDLITRYMRQGHLALAYRFYAGERHEILNEAEKDQVHRDVGLWLAQVLDRKGDATATMPSAPAER